LGSESVEIRRINPWTYQDSWGFSQAIEVTGANRVLHVSGQTSISPEGTPQHEGDMAAQIALALDNFETVLGEAGMTFSNVVRLDYYTTDMDAFLASNSVLASRLTAANIQPVSTLLGVARLVLPQLLVEIDGIAVA
jgi:enamine deaminase RidA (YjgF/YER057c/UK114 family)